MASLRKNRLKINRLMRDRRFDADLEDRQWDRMPAVGREFGSPDFERLMAEDYRNGGGVFDPGLKGLFGNSARSVGHRS